MRNLSKSSIKQLKKTGKLICLKTQNGKLHIGIADTWLIWPLKNKIKGVKIINA